MAAALLQFLDEWSSRWWSRFFCLSVYVTMYLNDHQRSAFYESLGLDTTQFNRCAAAASRPSFEQATLPAAGACSQRRPRLSLLTPLDGSVLLVHP